MAMAILGLSTGAFAQSEDGDFPDSNGDIRTTLTLFGINTGQNVEPTFLPLEEDRFGVMIEDILIVPETVTQPTVYDIDVSGKISNNGKTPMLVMVFIGNPAAVSAHPWAHLVIKGFVAPGENRNFDSMVTPLWEPKMAKQIMNAYGDDVKAYLAVFSNEPVTGNTMGLQMYTILGN